MDAVNQSELATKALQRHAGRVPYKSRYIEALMQQSGVEAMLLRAFHKVMISSLALAPCLTPGQNFSYP